jgi:hypothetical protein
MIIYLNNREIDREQWDNCLKSSSVTSPWPYSWYLDIMSPGWEALIDDDYDSVFPIPARQRFGIKYIITPAFTRQLGAYSPDKPSEEVTDEFLQYLPDFYKYIDLHVSHRTQQESFRITEKSYYRLDIDMPYEKIFDQFSPQCKRNIESSLKKGIELTNDIKPDELINLFLHDSKNRIKGVLGNDFQRLRDLMNFCIINRKGKITGVRDGRKKLLYGLFCIDIRGSKTILFEVSTKKSVEKRIGYFTLNDLIKSSAGIHRTLDFAGYYNPSSAVFLESFGAVKDVYYRLYRNRLLCPVPVFRHYL